MLISPCFVLKFVEWVEEPVIDILDTTSYPIEKVDFPTVTLCQDSPNTDRWGPVIKVFDYMNLICPNK